MISTDFNDDVGCFSQSSVLSTSLKFAACHGCVIYVCVLNIDLPLRLLWLSPSFFRALKSPSSFGISPTHKQA